MAGGHYRKLSTYVDPSVEPAYYLCFTCRFHPDPCVHIFVRHFVSIAPYTQLQPRYPVTFTCGVQPACQSRFAPLASPPSNTISSGSSIKPPAIRNSRNHNRLALRMLVMPLWLWTSQHTGPWPPPCVPRIRAASFRRHRAWLHFQLGATSLVSLVTALRRHRPPQLPLLPLLRLEDIGGCSASHAFRLSSRCKSW